MPFLRVRLDQRDIFAEAAEAVLAQPPRKAGLDQRGLGLAQLDPRVARA
jgi:hypothetical protein